MTVSQAKRLGPDRPDYDTDRDVELTSLAFELEGRTLLEKTVNSAAEA